MKKMLFAEMYDAIGEAVAVTEIHEKKMKSLRKQLALHQAAVDVENAKISDIIHNNEIIGTISDYAKLCKRSVKKPRRVQNTH